MRYLCSGFGANVTICGACAAKVGKCGACAVDLLRKSPYAVPAQRICMKTAVGADPRGGLVKHAFSSKVSVLPRREHRLFENQVGGVPLSDFTVTLHLQCNLTELWIYTLARHAVNTMLKHSAADFCTIEGFASAADPDATPLEPCEAPGGDLELQVAIWSSRWSFEAPGGRLELKGAI